MRVLLPLYLVLLAQAPDPAPTPDDEPPHLFLSDPIACRSIKGYEDYQPLEEPALTKDEKLFIYLRPSDHTIEPTDDGKFKIHLVEDVNVHRKGQKRVLWGKDKIIDYEETTEFPLRNVYLGSILSLKELPVGEYTAEIIVHDKLRKDEKATVTLDFRVVKASAPKE